jgi:hypothetical protein
MVNTAGAQSAIGNGQTLNSDAAAQWLALVARIKRETGIAITATEGTRTYARQKYLYDGYRAGRAGFNPAWSPASPFAYHLSGRAVDVGSGVGYLVTTASREFYARAGQHGFRPTVKGEPWHFEWRAEWVSIPLEVASYTPTPIPEKEEDDMPKIIGVSNKGGVWVVDFGAKTKWNIAAGLPTVEAAAKRQRLMEGMGAEFYDGQPASLIDSFTDITNR